MRIGYEWKLLLAATALVVSATFAGCATTPLRTETSTSGIRAAEELGAENVPRASYHLQLAREGLSQAQTLSDKGEKARAQSMLLRAEVDAELAIALTHEDAEKTSALTALEDVQQLRRNNP